MPDTDLYPRYIPEGVLNNLDLYPDLKAHLQHFDDINLLPRLMPYSIICRATDDIESNLSDEDDNILAYGISKLTSQQQALTAFPNASYILKVPPTDAFITKFTPETFFNFPHNFDPSTFCTYYAFYPQYIMAEAVNSTNLNEIVLDPNQGRLFDDLIHRCLFQPNASLLKRLAQMIREDAPRKTIYDTSSGLGSALNKSLEVDPLVASEVLKGYFDEVRILTPEERRKAKYLETGIQNNIKYDIEQKKPVGLRCIDRDHYYTSEACMDHLANANLIVELIDQYSLWEKISGETQADEIAYVYAFFENQVLVEKLESQSIWGPDDNQSQSANNGYLKTTLFEASDELYQLLLDRVYKKAPVSLRFRDYKRLRFER